MIFSDLLATLPNFLAYGASAIVLMSAFVYIYTAITPHREFALIKAGNVAASISLSGALLGFVLALASVIEHSVSLIDMVIWGIVALIVQLLAYFLVRLALPALSQGIEDNNISKAILLASTAISFGLINAACMVY
jgi:putative membrane protein